MDNKNFDDFVKKFKKSKKIKLNLQKKKILSNNEINEILKNYKNSTENSKNYLNKSKFKIIKNIFYL